MDDSRTVGNVRREGVTWTYGVDGVHTTVTPGGRRNGSPGNVHGTHTGRTSQGSAARTACPYRAPAGVGTRTVSLPPPRTAACAKTTKEPQR